MLKGNKTSGGGKECAARQVFFLFVSFSLLFLFSGSRDSWLEGRCARSSLHVQARFIVRKLLSPGGGLVLASAGTGRVFVVVYMLRRNLFVLWRSTRAPDCPNPAV